MALFFKRSILIIVALIILVSNLVSAISVGLFASSENAKVWRIIEDNSIKGSSLYSEVVIDGFVNDTRIVKPDHYFEITLIPVGDEKFKVFNIEVYSNCSYWEYINCSNKLEFNNTPYMIDINKTSFNLTEIPISPYGEIATFHIKMDYAIENFVRDNGNYKIAWLKNYYNGVPVNDIEKDYVSHTLMLPSNDSIIESLYNFEIVNAIDGKWILKVEDINKGAIVTYREYGAEVFELNFRNTIIIVLAIASSLFLGFFFQAKRFSLITKLFFGFAGLFIFVCGSILMWKIPNVDESFLILFFIGITISFFFIILGVASIADDYSNDITSFFKKLFIREKLKKIKRFVRRKILEAKLRKMEKVK